MRILFFEYNPIWINGLPNGFRDHGHEVFFSGLVTSEQIQTVFSQYKPDLVFTLGWSHMHFEDKLIALKKACKKLGVPHVFWATEDPTYTDIFTLPVLKAAQPDFVFTICKFRVEKYITMGFKAAHLDFGYHPQIHFPRIPDNYHKADIGIVANGYPLKLRQFRYHFRRLSLANLLTPLLKEAYKVGIYGTGWQQMNKILRKPVPSQWINGELPYLRTNLIYNSSAIVLGLQNYEHQVTQRTYEILGAGCFLLTSDTQALRELGRPGQDFMVSSSPTKTLKLIKHFLQFEEERLDVQKNGFEIIKRHSYTHRAEYINTILKTQGIIN
jgi:spore maturation protein CgeB